MLFVGIQMATFYMVIDNPYCLHKNVDFCGILNLLAALKRAGFPKTELEQVAVRIAVQTGATIPISF